MARIQGVQIPAREPFRAGGPKMARLKLEGLCMYTSYYRM